MEIKIKNKDARIPLRNKKTKNEPKYKQDFFKDNEDFDEDAFFDKEFDINFRDPFGDKSNKKYITKRQQQPLLLMKMVLKKLW